LLETPGTRQLRNSLTRRLPRTLLETAIDWTTYISLAILLPSIAIALIMSAVKLGIQWEHQRWEEMLLVRTAYICIPLLFPTGFFVWSALDTLGHVKLLALFEVIQNTLRKRRADVFYDDEDDAESKQTPGSVPVAVQWKYAKALLFTHNYPLWSPPQLVHRLGAVSVLCCSNKEGVLTDNVSYIDKISVLQSATASAAAAAAAASTVASTTSVAAANTTTASATTTNTATDNGTESPDHGRTVLILELSRDPGRRKGRFRFNDLHWQEKHLTRLKPLGLNCLLNSRCGFGGYIGTGAVGTLHSGQQQAGDNRLFQRWDQCLCLLGKEIGFSEGALDSYVPLREIHHWRPAPHQPERPVSKNPALQTMNRRSRPELWHMISVPVFERSREATQLFCKGDPALVLENCSLAFDGTEIKPFLADEKARIIELQKQWGSHHCVAFSFKLVVNDDDLRLFTSVSPDGTTQVIDTLSAAEQGLSQRFVSNTRQQSTKRTEQQ
jgi:hypothetical protein